VSCRSRLVCAIPFIDLLAGNRGINRILRLGPKNNKFQMHQRKHILLEYVFKYFKLRVRVLILAHFADLFVFVSWCAPICKPGTSLHKGQSPQTVTNTSLFQ
jgi:hypothetical protein